MRSQDKDAAALCLEEVAKLNYMVYSTVGRFEHRAFHSKSPIRISKWAKSGSKLISSRS